MDLFEELDEIVSAIQPTKYLLAGGMAYSVLVEPRFTHDINIAISAGDAESTFEKLVSAGFLNQKKVLRFENLQISRCIKLGEADHVVCDLLLLDNDDFRAMYEGRLRLVRDNKSLDVLAPDDLIRMKERRNSEQDKIDITRLRNQ